MGPRGRITHVIVDWDRFMQVMYLGRAPRTKETLPDFLKWRRVTRHPLLFRGLTGSQRTLGIWGCGPYPIHGPARLAFKWKENVKRKCGLIFEFWKIRPRGGTVLLWSCHLLLFLFLSGENQVRTKNPNDSSMEKSGLRKLDFWVRGSDYLSGRYFIRGSTLLGPELGLY